MKHWNTTAACSSIRQSGACQGAKWGRHTPPCLEKLRLEVSASDWKQDEEALRLYHADIQAVCENTTSCHRLLPSPSIIGVCVKDKSQSKRSFADSREGSQDLTLPLALPHHIPCQAGECSTT